MNVLQLSIPPYLLVKRNIVGIISFTAIFALAFLNFYHPFGVEFWYDLSKIEILAYSSIIILMGVGVIVISRIIMYQVGRFRKVTYLSLGIFMLSEIFGMAFFYTLIGKYGLQDDRLFVEVLRASFKNTALVLFIPYSVTWLYYALRDKAEKLKELSENELSTPVANDKMVSFYDEKGTLRFSVVITDLLYLEASDNYVMIHYKSASKISKYMVRNTLKNMEEQLLQYHILRCHRSFLINSKIIRLLRREKEGLFLELNVEQDIKLPVSKTYISNVVDSLSEVHE